MTVYARYCARRRYDASSRQAAAAVTRGRILFAARSLFLTRGFAATAMTDVADHAGVAVQTVYPAVGGKVALLQRVMDVAIAGDDAPIPILDRPDGANSRRTPAIYAWSTNAVPKSTK